MSASMTLTEEQEINLHIAKKLLGFAGSLASADGHSVQLDPEEIAVFAQIIKDLLPEDV